MKTPAEYVSPYIGTFGHLLTSTRPIAALPHSPATVFPNVTGSEYGDYYIAEKIKSFPIGPAEIAFAPDGASDAGAAVSRYDVGAVDSHPYSITVYLEETGITVSATTAMHSYVYRAEGAERIFIGAKNGSVKRKGESLFVNAPQGERGRRAYIKLSLSCPFSADIKDGETVISVSAPVFEVYAALSYVSEDKAEEIFERELKGCDYAEISAKSKEIWEDLLGRISVRGASEDVKTVYYTALYRSFGKMYQYGEYGSYYSGYDSSVHKGDDFYTADQLWDSFRCMHPLQLLLEPERHRVMLGSYIDMYRQTGAMPSFPGVDGDRPVMFGHHAAALFADAIVKGVDADYETAYRGIRRNATEISMLPWVGDVPAGELERCYYEKGFYPALDEGESEYIKEAHPFERRQSVAVTLEHAYDDFCVALLAEKLGYKDDAAAFYKRSKNYKNVYNKEIGFMAPKNKEGNWVRNFDPVRGGGQGGRAYFAECNAFTFNFSVWHDVEGLADLMGGPGTMAERLDQLFSTAYPPKFGFLDQFPDSTGLMGMFCMGNEPSFHIPYLYNYVGRPWMAQRRLRAIMDLWFTNSPLGICGDDDSGAMSSWFAFSAIGLYPVCPGKAEYALSSPLFDEVRIKVAGGEFVIKAEGAGSGLRYIKSAALNGKPYDRAFISHNDLVSGGELILEMSDKPNINFGKRRV